VSDEASAGAGDATRSAAPPIEPVGDNGWLAALCLLARLHHIAAEPAHLMHQLGWPPSHRPSVPDLLLAAKQMGLKAKLVRSSAERLTLAPLPALALVDDAEGGRRPVVLAQCDGQRVLFQDPSQAIQGGRPVIEPAASFVARWTGELILVTSRASLGGELAKFDFSWFVPSLVKYRRLFGRCWSSRCSCSGSRSSARCSSRS
jgi:subfamily B ATP-binding cassette protein HlyB/CyaB